LSTPGSARLSGIRSVLFDLDGTLIDTAPDMVAVLVAMQADRGHDPVDYKLARSNVSNGAIGLIRLAFPGLDDAAEKQLHVEFLDRYEVSVCDKSRVFSGLGDLLDRLDDAAYPWGVVTNKPGRMSEPLLAALNLSSRMACIVSGDTIAERKPHPAPLLLASRTTGIAPQNTVYVGDAARDIEAGRAAGMYTVGAAYGYITEDDDPRSWEADVLAANTEELTQILLEAVNLQP
jgi:2-phosphoglycolate phosphatase